MQIAADLPYVEKLLEELQAVEVRQSPSGHEQYAAWREGTHDDLVFAVALAYWSSQKVFPSPGRERDQWWTNAYQEDAGVLFRRWKAEEERMSRAG